MLSPSRCKAIAAIIRASGAFLIEDDAYGWLDPSASPVANLIPERSYLAVSCPDRLICIAEKRNRFLYLAWAYAIVS